MQILKMGSIPRLPFCIEEGVGDNFVVVVDFCCWVVVLVRERYNGVYFNEREMGISKRNRT